MWYIEPADKCYVIAYSEKNGGGHEEAYVRKENIDFLLKNRGKELRPHKINDDPNGCDEYWSKGEDKWYICYWWRNRVLDYKCECVLDDDNLEDVLEATDEDGQKIKRPSEQGSSSKEDKN